MRDARERWIDRSRWRAYCDYTASERARLVTELADAPKMRDGNCAKSVLEFHVQSFITGLSLIGTYSIATAAGKSTSAFVMSHGERLLIVKAMELKTQSLPMFLSWRL
jgi:hypothetical protein